MQWLYKVSVSQMWAEGWETFMFVSKIILFIHKCTLLEMFQIERFVLYRSVVWNYSNICIIRVTLWIRIWRWMGIYILHNRYCNELRKICNDGRVTGITLRKVSVSKFKEMGNYPLQNKCMHCRAKKNLWFLRKQTNKQSNKTNNKIQTKEKKKQTNKTTTKPAKTNTSQEKNIDYFNVYYEIFRINSVQANVVLVVLLQLYSSLLSYCSY